VRLSREVNYDVDFILPEQRLHQHGVTDVAMNKLVSGIGIGSLQVFLIAGVCELVEVDNSVVRMQLQHVPDEVAPDKSRTACDKDVHLLLMPPLLKE
jgi:hypothetical protein